MTIEIRTRKLTGSNHVRHAIVVDGVEVHAQLSPYSDDELEQRIAAASAPVLGHNFRLAEFVPGARGTAKSYGARGGKAKRRPQTAAGAEPWEPQEDQ